MAAPLDRHWVLASSNPGKIREFEPLFGPLGIRLSPQRDFAIADAPEPHPTFVENALAKARHASALAGLPGLADDSGLCVAALGGAPGVHSARYATLDPDGRLDEALIAGGREAIDAANNRRLIADLAAVAERGRLSGSGVPEAGAPDSGAPGWRAWYVCCIVWVADPRDPCPVIAEGRWTGRIIAEPRGAGGFGYDAHFLIDGEGLTAAELAPARKNAISHRAIASRRLLAVVADRLGADPAAIPSLSPSPSPSPSQSRPSPSSPSSPSSPR